MVIERKGICQANTWNIDEVSTALGVTYNQTVIGTVATDATVVKRPNDREWCTAIEAISVAGSVCKPLLIFKAKHVQQQWFIADQTPDWAYTSSAAAFTTNEIGLKWLQEIFVPHVHSTLAKEEWVLLLLDGHGSHITPDFMLYAYQHRV